MDSNGYAPSLIKKSYGECDSCFLCGRTSGKLDRHEIFHGPYRQKSKRLGLWVTLCHECHMDLHQHDANKDRALKNLGQLVAMGEFKWNIYDFRREFGKNYLDIEEDT